MGHPKTLDSRKNVSSIPIEATFSPASSTIKRTDRVVSGHEASTRVSFCFTHSRMEAERKTESEEAADNDEQGLK